MGWQHTSAVIIKVTAFPFHLMPLEAPSVPRQGGDGQGLGRSKHSSEHLHLQNNCQARAWMEWLFLRKVDLYMADARLCNLPEQRVIRAGTESDSKHSVQ